jgi:hypothetical protein
VPTLLAMLLLGAVAGCGSHPSAQAPADQQTVNTTPSSETVVANLQPPATLTPMTRPAGTVHLITLTNHRCIRFEPQWTRVRMGQSITWRSDLKTPITIYVSPGVFRRDNFRVRPGATVTTGPALASGRYSFWTEPAACREAPRGILLAGPGVKVQENYYVSTGPR